MQWTSGVKIYYHDKRQAAVSGKEGQGSVWEKGVGFPSNISNIFTETGITGEKRRLSAEIRHNSIEYVRATGFKRMSYDII